MKNHEKPQKTMKTHENQPGTMKNQLTTIKNHKKPSGTMKNRRIDRQFASYGELVFSGGNFSDTVVYPKQFQMKNPVRHCLPQNLIG